MPTEISRIVDQFERAYSGDAWHGPPLRELLAGVDGAMSAAHPVGGGHSIWELTEHVAFWLDAVRRRLAGEVLDLHDGDDWHVERNPTPERWQAAMDALDASYRRLLTSMQVLSDPDLERIVPVKGYTNYVMLHGVIQHTLYHAGQIALLARASSATADRGLP